LNDPAGDDAGAIWRPHVAEALADVAMIQLFEDCKWKQKTSKQQ
jgi:hypothetical protein